MRPRLSWRVVTALALPLLVWYLGAFFFHGQLGKWIDDYGDHLRDPATGDIHWGELFRYQWWFFWRPIHIYLIYTLQTFTYNHDWINHLFSALMHALACFGLWKFLRECGLRPIACAAPALVMLGSVQGFEAILWPATVSTTIATGAFFWAGWIVVRHAQGRSTGRPMLALGVLGFAIPCMYEQPAAALAALPILYMGAAGRRMPLIRGVRRMVLALAPCGLAVIAYLVLYLVSVRSDPMAREANFSRSELAWPRAMYLLRALGSNLLPVGGLDELWRAGQQSLASSALGVIGWTALAIAATNAWLWTWWPWHKQSDAKRHEDPPTDRVSNAALVLFGLCGMLLALLPIVAIAGAGLSLRLVYFPLACALLVCGALIDAALSIPRLARPTTVVVSLASAGLALMGCIHLIGAQSCMRKRFDKDQAFMRSLLQAAPNPAPGTLLVPIIWSPDPGAPASSRIVSSLLPIWTSPWGINTEIKRVYGRDDVNAAAIYSPDDPGAILRLGSPTTIAWSHYQRLLPTPRKDALSPTVPLSTIIPYTITASGEASVVGAVLARTPDGRAARVEFPQARSARELARAIPIENGRPWVSDWVWTHRSPATGSPKVKTERLLSWGFADVGMHMHPPVPGFRINDGDTDQMEVPLAPGGPRKFIFHATFEESAIDLNILGDGVDITWSVGDTVLKKLFLNPSDIKARRAWETVVVDVPASAASKMLRVTVGPGPKGDPSYDRVVVTCGEEELGNASTYETGVFPSPSPSPPTPPAVLP